MPTLLKDLAISLVALTGLSAQAPPVDAQTRVQKNVENWIVNCLESVDSVSRCSISQTFTRAAPQGDQRLFMFQLTLARSDTAPDVLVLRTPLGVRLDQKIALSLDGGEADDVEFFRCTRNGCVTRTEVTPDFLSAFSGASEATANYVLGNGRPVKVTVKMGGFRDAYRFTVDNLQ